VLRLLKLPLRRLFAAVSTAAVLTAPVSQLAHVEAMAQEAGGCAAMAMAMEMAPSASPAAPAHAPSHHHDASCCDFCGIGCCAALGTVPTTIAAIGTAPLHHAAVATSTLRAGDGPAPHFHPFSHAPPRLTA
jgi:hypothetical protein